MWCTFTAQREARTSSVSPVFNCVSMCKTNLSISGITDLHLQRGVILVILAAVRLTACDIFAKP